MDKREKLAEHLYWNVGIAISWEGCRAKDFWRDQADKILSLLAEVPAKPEQSPPRRKGKTDAG